PSLTQKITWSEQKRTILLTGVRGEAALMHRDPKKPILEVVPHGKAVLGYELHQSLGLKPGSAFRLMGKRFIVDKCHEARGTVDDITIWINLDEAQAMLNKPGQINSILALECNCFSIDRLGDVRREVAAILPHTKVIEQGSKALARAEARQAAKKAAQQQLEQARATAAKELAAARQARQELRQKREAFAALLAPLVIVLCAVWVAALTFANVRERVNEIGILRALGVRASTVLSVFLLKASAMGLAGAFVGCAVASEVLRQKLFSGYSAVVVLSPVEWLGAICLAPLLACLAAWPPAVLAAQQDPASVLREE
ncbi:MAG: ABC transporter permease, partial [Anaerolineales bacterium]